MQLYYMLEQVSELFIVIKLIKTMPATGLQSVLLLL